MTHLIVSEIRMQVCNYSIFKMGVTMSVLAYYGFLSMPLLITLPTSKIWISLQICSAAKQDRMSHNNIDLVLTTHVEVPQMYMKHFEHSTVLQYYLNV